MPADTTHECPARGCTRRVPRSKLMCWEHWRLVPPALQTRVYRTYRSADVAAHTIAMRDAIAAVNAGLEATSNGLEATVALIEAGGMTMDEALFPHLLPEGRRETVYEAYITHEQLQIGEGDRDDG